MVLVADKILTLEESTAWRNECWNSWETVVLTNGVYDVLHKQHCSYLEQARAMGDRLIVLVNGDRAVKLLKGPSRPLNSEYDRMFVIGGLQAVDRVCLVDDMRVTKYIEALRPDIYVKSGDRSLETLDQDERLAIESSGGKIVFVPYVPGYSSTNLINKLALG